MQLAPLLTALLALTGARQLGPRLAYRALAYALLALAVACLMVAGWRVLELAFGPLLGPLVAAVLLAGASAGVFGWLERPAPRQPASEALSHLTMLAPLAATLVAPLALPALKYLLHPRRMAGLAVVATAALAAGAVGRSTATRPAGRRDPSRLARADRPR